MEKKFIKSLHGGYVPCKPYVVRFTVHPYGNANQYITSSGEIYNGIETPYGELTGYQVSYSKPYEIKRTRYK